MTQAHRVKVRQKLAKFAYNPETENKLLKNCLMQNIPAPEEMRGGGVIENVKFDKKVPSKMLYKLPLKSLSPRIDRNKKHNKIYEDRLKTNKFLIEKRNSLRSLKLQEVRNITCSPEKHTKGMTLKTSSPLLSLSPDHDMIRNDKN